MPPPGGALGDAAARLADRLEALQVAVEGTDRAGLARVCRTVCTNEFEPLELRRECLPWVGLGEVPGMVAVLACAGPRCAPQLASEAAELARRAITKESDNAVLAYVAEHLQEASSLAALAGLKCLNRSVGGPAWIAVWTHMLETYGTSPYWQMKQCTAPLEELLGSLRLDARAAAGVRLSALCAPLSAVLEVLASHPWALAVHLILGRGAGDDDPKVVAEALAEALTRPLEDFAATWRTDREASTKDQGQAVARECAPVLWAMRRVLERPDAALATLNVVVAVAVWTDQVPGVVWADAECRAFARACCEVMRLPAGLAKQLRSRLAKEQWTKDPCGCFGLLLLCDVGPREDDWLPPLLALADDFDPALACAAWQRVREMLERDAIDQLELLGPAVDRGLCSRDGGVVEAVCLCAQWLITKGISLPHFLDFASRDARYAATSNPAVFISLATHILLPVVKVLDVSATRKTRALLDACLQGVSVAKCRPTALNLYDAVIIACEPRVPAHRDACLAIVLRAAIVGVDCRERLATLRDLVCKAGFETWWNEAMAMVRANEQLSRSIALE